MLPRNVAAVFSGLFLGKHSRINRLSHDNRFVFECNANNLLTKPLASKANINKINININKKLNLFRIYHI